jgi:hypothetical protein
MMFSPDVLLAGVGQSVTGSEIYGSPHCPGPREAFKRP